jgi:hypothetical protein
MYNENSMFAVFNQGLKGITPKAILEVQRNPEEARSHACPYHMPGGHLAPIC